MPDEEVLANRADIASMGDPEPVRTGQEIQGGTQQKVNQKQVGGHTAAPRSTTPGQQRSDSGGAHNAPPGPPNPLEGLGKLAQKAFDQRPFKGADNPFSPIDWAKQTAN